MAVAVSFCESGQGFQLVAGEAAAEDGGSYGGEAGLALGGDADVVAVDVVVSGSVRGLWNPTSQN